MHLIQFNFDILIMLLKLKNNSILNPNKTIHEDDRKFGLFITRVIILYYNIICDEFILINIIIYIIYFLLILIIILLLY